MTFARDGLAINDIINEICQVTSTYKLMENSRTIMILQLNLILPELIKWKINEKFPEL